MDPCLRKLEKENMSHEHHRGRENMMGQGGHTTEEWGFIGSHSSSHLKHNSPLRCHH